MAGLLVSVRSAIEAQAALAGGATVIDIKEPARGPLGAADPAVWHAVRQVVPADVPLSAALGELARWREREREPADPSACSGLSYLKVGLAGCGSRPTSVWQAGWAQLRQACGGAGGPEWVAVVYADWRTARAPHPDDVVDFALAADCAGVLIDTWDKGRPSPVDLSWRPRVARIQHAGRFVALAGGLDEAAIRRLSGLGPDLYAVRGAACAGRNRLTRIDPSRVARLARAAISAQPSCSLTRRFTEPA